MYRFRIHDHDGLTLCTITAKGHVQHIHNRGELTGVSKSGQAKLAAIPDDTMTFYSHDGDGTAQHIRLAGWSGDRQ